MGEPTQHYFRVEFLPRYCNTHRDWVTADVKCPSKCCNGWKRREELYILARGLPLEEE